MGQTKHGGKTSMSEQYPTVDAGPYLSQIYKHTIFREVDFTDREDIVKFIHFNTPTVRKRLKGELYKKLQDRTVAILAPSAQKVYRIVEEYLENKDGTDFTVNMVVGVAFCNKQDQFSKEVGRDQAVSKLEDVSLTIESVKINNKHVYVDFKTYKGVNLAIRLNKSTGFTTILGEFPDL